MISIDVIRCSSLRPASAASVLPDPSPTTAASRGCGWIIAGSAPSSVWVSAVRDVALTEAVDEDIDAVATVRSRAAT